MRVLFCHDGPLRKDENGSFYGIAHNDEVFRRYYKIGDELAVAIRVGIISEAEAIEKFSKITVSPFEVIQCPNLSSLSGYILERHKVKSIITAEVKKSDFIVARLPSQIGNLAIDIAVNDNKPYLVELVACPWDGLWNHSFRGKLFAPIMYRATWARVKHADFVIYVTNEFLQSRYPTHGRNISCSNVSISNIKHEVLEKRLIKIASVNDNEKLIIGTLAAVDVKFKGQQYIIKALGRLKKQGVTKFEYHLVGNGDQSYLKSLAKKHDVLNKVKFLGSMPHEEIFTWLDSIDLYIQPSRQEGLPRSLIEAMSRGLPAIGAKTGGIPELLDPNYIFSNSRRNIDEICDKLRSFNKQTMLTQARRNFSESKKYDRTIIESRRYQFFDEFKRNS